MHGRGDRTTVAGGGDVRDCHGRDMREDGCIELCEASSLLAQPSVDLSVLLKLEGKGACSGGNSDCHRERSGVE